MARLATRSLSSEDELPELSTLLRKAGGRSTRSSKPETKSAVKALVPKSTTTSSTRRVRRLAEPSQLNDNSLFQKWNSNDKDVPRRSRKAKAKEPQVEVHEINSRRSESPPSLHQGSESHIDGKDEEDERDDEPQLRVRRARRKPVIEVEQSEEDTDEASGSDTETLITRVKRLQKARIASGDLVQKAAVLSSLSEEETAKAPARPAEQERQKAMPAKEEQIRSKQIAGHVEREEDPSFYLTAEEESSEYSEGSASEFEIENSPDQPKDMMPARILFSRPSKPTELKGSISPIKNVPPLRPRNADSGRGRAANGRREDSPSDEESSSRLAGLSVDLDEDLLLRGARPTPTPTASDLADTLSKLRIQLEEFSGDEKKPKNDDFTTPPSTPPKTLKPKGLVSPSKRIQIPKTPHRPSMDAFWSQEMVNDWNDHHSPRKLVLPPVVKSPAKASPKKDGKKAFEARKHTLAEGFLKELDEEITQSKIAQLAESTGGVKIVWTKTLNTTAGRANWRREAIRTKQADGKQISVVYKHHASIELAEKVIDDEHRLLNVLAHEFCHLANFMVSGITTNPHGKEFKAWATKCSLAFGDRGINVTTKHTYEIDFKYIWECTACCAEYKRHSKSIDPQRHRCGSCKSLLKQTKPVPRNGGGKASKYQVFMKEQMKVVREENPGSPQKEVMRLVAAKWAKQGGKKGVDDVVSQIVDLTIEE